MNFFCSLIFIFITSFLSTNPPLNQDMDINMLPAPPNKKQTEQESETETVGVFLLDLFDESRKLYKQEILTEKKDCSFTAFLENIFISLIKECKRLNKNEDEDLNEYEQIVLDELMLELKVKYDNITKHENENKYEVQITAKNLIEENWSKIETRFRESNENERKLIFTTLIEKYLLEKTNFAKVQVIEYDEIEFLKQKTYQTISRLKPGHFSNCLFKDSAQLTIDFLAKIPNLFKEIERVNSEEKQIALEKYDEVVSIFHRLQRVTKTHSHILDEEFFKIMLPIMKTVFQKTMYYISENERMPIVNTNFKRDLYKTILVLRYGLDVWCANNSDIYFYTRIIENVINMKLLSKLFSKIKISD